MHWHNTVHHHSMYTVCTDPILYNVTLCAHYALTQYSTPSLYMHCMHWRNTLHHHSMYTVCTDTILYTITQCKLYALTQYSTPSLNVHCMHWLTQYGRWDFLRYTVGFINCGKVRTITFNLFIWIWSKISELFPLIKHQYFHNLSLQLKSHVPQTNNHFSPYLSIWIPDNLTINKLAHTVL